MQIARKFGMSDVSVFVLYELQIDVFMLFAVPTIGIEIKHIVICVYHWIPFHIETEFHLILM